MPSDRAAQLLRETAWPLGNCPNRRRDSIEPSIHGLGEAFCDDAFAKAPSGLLRLDASPRVRREAGKKSLAAI
jgi:hypothetical protein